MSEQELKAAILAKTAAYKAANTQAKKASFGLPVASVGFTFATKAQSEELERQTSAYDFSNVHPSL